MGLSNTVEETREGNEIALRIVSEGSHTDEKQAGGQTHVADAIAASARRKNVQIRKDPVMIETLAHFNISESIPPELYSVVSEILTFLQKLESAPK